MTKSLLDEAFFVKLISNRSVHLYARNRLYELLRRAPAAPQNIFFMMRGEPGWVERSDFTIPPPSPLMLPLPPLPPGKLIPSRLFYGSVTSMAWFGKLLFGPSDHEW